jgi:hypothetical protein
MQERKHLGTSSTDDLVDALLQSELMEETAAYLRRGRSFSAASTEGLNELWIVAFRTWFGSRNAEDQGQMEDLAAELRLRGFDPPFDTVQAELTLARAEVREDGPSDEGIRQKIRGFLESINDPDA